MGHALIVLEVEGASASEDQALVTDLVNFAKQHRATPSKVRGVLTHAAFIRAEA